MLVKAGALTMNRDADTGLVTSLVAGSHTTAFVRNAFGEPESFTSKHNATNVFGESYTRDNSGRITAKTETRGTTATNWVYTYDATDRLTGVSKNGTPVSTYVYDANGNRSTSQVRRGHRLRQRGPDRQRRRAGVHVHVLRRAADRGLDHLHLRRAGRADAGDRSPG